MRKRNFWAYVLVGLFIVVSGIQSMDIISFEGGQSASPSPEEALRMMGALLDPDESSFLLQQIPGSQPTGCSSCPTVTVVCDESIPPAGPSYNCVTCNMKINPSLVLAINAMCPNLGLSCPSTQVSASDLQQCLANYITPPSMGGCIFLHEATHAGQQTDDKDEREKQAHERQLQCLARMKADYCTPMPPVGNPVRPLCEQLLLLIDITQKRIDFFRCMGSPHSGESRKDQCSRCMAKLHSSDKGDPETWCKVYCKESVMDGAPGWCTGITINGLGATSQPSGTFQPSEEMTQPIGGFG